jgi:hypothetical protein
MVGDYFSRMATAQNMPPQALTKSVQNGVLTPNMASDAMQSQARPAPSRGIQSLQEPPIAQQVMQEANQLTAPEKLAQEIDHVRSNIQKVQEGVQAGSIEAYKGIPFLKEQINTLRSLEQQLQALTNPQQAMQQMPQMPAQQAPQMPPQQMAQAPQGIDAAQSNLPAEGYAGGGIVAFADNKNQPVNANMPAEDDTAYDPFTGVPIYGATTTSPGLQKRLPPTNYFLDPKWKRELAKEQALEIPKIKPPVEVAPVAETKKDTGIFIHDTKPSSGGGIKREPPIPRTDLGIPLVYGPPEEDGIAKFEKKKDANYEELKKAILGDPAERDKQSTIQTLLKIMGRGFEAAGGTSPYAMANIGPAAAKGAGDIAELYAQQEAAKEKRVGQLVALGLKGQELDAELVKLGITKKYYDMHAPLLAAQAAEAQAKIPLYAAQTDYFYRRPTTGSGGMTLGPITGKDYLTLQEKYKALGINPKSDPTFFAALPQNVKDALEASPKTDSYKRGIAESQRIAKTLMQQDINAMQVLGARKVPVSSLSYGEEP